MSTTRLEFHPLTYVEERDGIAVGRADIESYALLPADGVALLKQLAGGMPVPEATNWYQSTFGEPVDMDDFVAALHDLGFVRDDGEPPAEPPKVRGRALGRAAFSPAAWVVYGAVAVAAVLAMALRPELRPRASNVFFVPSLIMVQLVLALFQPPVTLFHEWYHLLAARRLGLPSRLTIGRRYYYVVVETHLNALLGVPRRQRYLPMLAGMLADLLLFGVLVLVAAADPYAGLSLVGRLALAVAYIIMFRVAWQFYIFLRTDLYYVLTTALGCTNLHEVTRAYLRDRFGWLPWVRESDWASGDWSPRDRKVAPWFALITLGGVGFLAVTIVLWTAPLVVAFGSRIAAAMSTSVTGAGFWDSIGSLLLIGFELVVMPVIAGRVGRRRAQTGSDQVPSTVPTTTS